jgi:DNA (cytosine-5)-methyltransferase 1
MKRLIVTDLFCGAGGTSTGVSQFAEASGRKLELVAVNHWERAVETHAANHPRAAHFCQDLTRLKPGEAVPGGKLDLLVASPECTHHSNARGGKPKNDQSRASAWVVLEWVTALKVDRVLIENVPEFVSWGPLGSDGKALASKKGEIFKTFIRALEAAGYRVEWRVLNAADFGAATSRRRLFIQAVRGRRKIAWPTPTHSRDVRANLFGTLPRWRAAREIIDWPILGESIFARKRPLSENTLKRIEAGLKKFGGAAAEPFLVAMNYLKSREHDQRYAHGMDDPLPTITGQSNRFAFIIPTNYGERPGQAPRTHSAESPMPTIVAGGQTHGVVEGCMVQLTHAGRYGLVEPFILPHRQFENMSVDDIRDPLRTVTAVNGGCNGVVQPFITPYYGTGIPDSTDDPLATVTSKDRFGLVEPDRVALDIRFRMLQPHELKAAMGFPRDYKITGNRGEQVKQIGNAVEVNQARALAGSMLGAGCTA